jgi:hypothetical protein
MSDQLRVLGATHMTGPAALRVLTGVPSIVVFGAVQSPKTAALIPHAPRGWWIPSIDVEYGLGPRGVRGSDGHACQQHGVFHVAVGPNSTLGLLTLVAAAYETSRPIVADDVLQFNRSLDGSRFRAATGCVAPAWPELVRRVDDFH